ncbi:MAG: AI-2E family transporter, partial [Parafilimonas terrae]|nr:AI-2E family transporter [Parafilimonas terrae]
MLDRKLQEFEGPVGPWRGAAPLAASGIAVVCFAAALALAWMSVGTLLLIFAGALLGVFLDGLTRGLGRVLPLPRALRLTIASLAVAVAVIGFGSYGGATIVQQGRDLGTTIKDQAGTVTGWLSERGIDVPSFAPQAGGKDGSTETGQREGGLGGLANGLLKGSGSFVSDAGSVLGPAAAVILGLF